MAEEKECLKEEWAAYQRDYRKKQKELSAARAKKEEEEVLALAEQEEQNRAQHAAYMRQWRGHNKKKEEQHRIESNIFGLLEHAVSSTNTSIVGGLRDPNSTLATVHGRAFDMAEKVLASPSSRMRTPSSRKRTPRSAQSSTAALPPKEFSAAVPRIEG